MGDFEIMRRTQHVRWRIDWWAVFARVFIAAGLVFGLWLYWKTLSLLGN